MVTKSGCCSTNTRTHAHITCPQNNLKENKIKSYQRTLSVESKVNHILEENNWDNCLQNLLFQRT